MVRKIIQIFCLVIILINTSDLKGQDLFFSQYQLSPANINPALVGNGPGARFSFHYRNQWPTIPNAYISYLGSYDQFIPSINTGVGAYILNDVLGDGIYKNLHVGASANYAIPFGEYFNFRVGIQGKLVNSRLDYNKLRFFDQIDPEFGFQNQFGQLTMTEENEEGALISYVSLALGGVFIYKDWYLGVSILNINEPNESRFSNTSPVVPNLITANVGGLIEVNEDFSVGPSILYAQQNEFAQIQLSSNFIYKQDFLAGLGYRHTISNTDALILSAGYKKDIFKFVYSYDVTLSDLSGNTGGAHEVGLIIDFSESPALKARLKSKSYNNCLKIFR